MQEPGAPGVPAVSFRVDADCHRESFERFGFRRSGALSGNKVRAVCHECAVWCHEGAGLWRGIDAIAGSGPVARLLKALIQLEKGTFGYGLVAKKEA
jgi:hypothetical protein